MDSIFTEVPDLIDSISPEDVYNCLLVCSSWKLDIPEKVFKRVMILKWPVLDTMLLLSQTPEQWVPESLLFDLKRGVLTRPVVFDRRTQSMSGGNIHQGWSGFSGGCSRLSDEGEVCWTFKAHGYNEIEATKHSFVFHPVPVLYAYYKLKLAIPCEIREGIVKAIQNASGTTYALFNQHSKSTSQFVTHGWSGFNNGRLQGSSSMNEFQRHGYVEKQRTKDYILYERNNDSE